MVVPAFETGAENGDGKPEVSHCDEFMAAVLGNSAADSALGAWTFPPEAVEPDAGAEPASPGSRTLGVRDESNSRRLV